MKILIQDRSTRLFYNGLGRWTANIEEAQEFSGALIAYQFSQQHSLGDTEIVFQMLNDESEPTIIAQKERTSHSYAVH